MQKAFHKTFCRKNKHSQKFSGLANFGKTVDVDLSGEGIVLRTSSKKKGGNLVSQQTRAFARRAASSAAATARNAGRPDLQVRKRQEGGIGMFATRSM